MSIFGYNNIKNIYNAIFFDSHIFFFVLFGLHYTYMQQRLWKMCSEPRQAEKQDGRLMVGWHGSIRKVRENRIKHLI